MTCSLATLVNTIGLALDVVGFTLIYFFGFPKVSGTIITFGGGPQRSYGPSERLSTLGFVFVVVGFLTQIASNHLGALSGLLHVVG